MSILNDLYTNPKYGYLSANKFYQRIKNLKSFKSSGLSRADVIKFVNARPSSQIMRPPSANKKAYLPIFSHRKGSFQIDLTFFPKYKSHNNGYDTLLTAINITTRRLYGYASRGKSGTNISKLLELFINEANPQVITSDNGSEFIDKRVKALFKRNNITHYLASAGDHRKMGMIERVHRTIKTNLNRYLIANNTARWVEPLNDIIENYNNTPHSSINQSPASVTEEDEKRIISEASIKTNAILNTESDETPEYVRVIPLRNSDKLGHRDIEYSTKVYKVNSITRNGAITVDGLARVIPRHDYISASKPEIEVDDSNLREARANTKQKRIIKKAGLDTSNIIRRGTRERRKVVKMDL